MINSFYSLILNFASVFKITPFSQSLTDEQRSRIPFLNLIKYLEGNLTYLFLAFLSSLIFTVFTLAEPWPLKAVIDYILLDQALPQWISNLIPGKKSITIILLVLFTSLPIVFSSLGGFFYYWSQVLSSYTAQRVISKLRMDVYRHIQYLDFSFHDRRSTGDLLIRMTNDINLLRDCLITLPIDISQNFFLLFSMSIIMLLIDYRLSFISFMLIPVSFVFIKKYRNPMKSAIRKQRKRQGELATTATESLGAYRMIQGLCLQESEIQRFASSNQKDLNQGLKASRLEAKLRWSTDISVSLVTCIILFFASIEVLNQRLNPGDLIIFLAYLKNFSRPLRRVSRTLERFSRSLTAGERVLTILDTMPIVKDPQYPLELTRCTGHVRFDHVWLRHHNGGLTLRDACFDVKPHEHVGIVGFTGSGKTSLISLIPRFYDPTQGSILIDGHDIRILSLHSLRSNISFLFQEPVLLASTVAHNIALGKAGSSLDDAVQASIAAGVHDTILALHNGYDTVIGERGATLSGGQRQSIAIARAMLTDAPILILDEPTTGLDPHSASKVMTSINKLMKGRTVFFVTHDINLLVDFNRIIVVDNGLIVETGAYRDLISSRDKFSFLTNSHIKDI